MVYEWNTLYFTEIMEYEIKILLLFLCCKENECDTKACFLQNGNGIWYILEVAENRNQNWLGERKKMYKSGTSKNVSIQQPQFENLNDTVFLK